MKKYCGIQALRFVAASLVVVEHLFGNIVKAWGYPSNLSIPPIGFIGVIVFFGISGFIMVTSQYDTFGKPGRAIGFFWRRVLRILPLYAIATTLQFINKRNFSDDYNFLNYAKALLFIPYIGEKNLYLPVLGQGWTLNFEMYFYLVFAISLMLSRASGLVLSIFIFAATAAAQPFVSQLNEVVAFYANFILLFFVCGMLVAVACRYLHWHTSSPFIPLATWAVVLAAGMWINLEQSSYVRFSYNFFMVLICIWVAVAYEPLQQTKVTRLAERLGDASYSTYLFHGFMLGVLKVLSNRIEEGDWFKAVIMALFAVILANMIGLIVYRFVEHPISRLLKRKAVPSISKQPVNCL
jgi:exopolysaccharide production protein ExoZ